MRLDGGIGISDAIVNITYLIRLGLFTRVPVLRAVIAVGYALIRPEVIAGGDSGYVSEAIIYAPMDYQRFTN
jgi:hypothetical protein